MGWVNVTILAYPDLWDSVVIVFITGIPNLVSTVGPSIIPALSGLVAWLFMYFSME